MKLNLKMIAIGLCLGLTAAPATVEAQPRHDRGWHDGRHDNGNHYGNRGRGLRHDRRWRGDHRRRVCRWDRHHGRRYQRCFWR